MSGPVPLVRVMRSGVEEAVHLGSVAVVDARGRLIAAAGDPAGVAFARSASKPFQAAASLSLMGENAGEELSDREVAVMCGSHHGEPEHLDAVGALLARAGLGPEALLCPPGLPLDPDAALAVTERRPEYHNCSGKHAGMLLASVRADLDTGTYPEEGHTVQRAALEVLSRAAGMEPAAVGVDGCGVPVHAFPLAALATMFARLSTPEDLGPFEAPARRATRALLAEPVMVSGTRGLDTALMRTVPRMVAKGGAEALQCAVLLEEGVAIAVKIADGGYRAAGPAVVRALRVMGLIGPSHQEALGGHSRPVVKGGGREVGELVADFDLERLT
ncbi:MAG: asparaginase [Actinomycetota bacterium]